MTAQAPSQSRPRVLLCEHEQAVARRIGYWLNCSGVLHDWAYNGRRARQWLNARKCLQRGTYDAVLTNLILEDQDGISLMLDLRAQGLAVPMFAISSHCGRAAAGRNRGDDKPPWLEPTIGYGRVLFALKQAASKIDTKAISILHLESAPALRDLVNHTLTDNFQLEWIGQVTQALSALQNHSGQIVLANPELADTLGRLVLNSLDEYCPPASFVFPGSIGLQGDGYDEDFNQESAAARDLIALVARCAGKYNRGVPASDEIGICGIN